MAEGDGAARAHCTAASVAAQPDAQPLDPLVQGAAGDAQAARGPLHVPALNGLAPVEPAPAESNTTQAEFEDMVRRGKEYIAAGDVFQFVPSQRFTTDFNRSPVDLYRALRHVNPSPYMFILELGDFALVGSSPEVHVRAIDGPRGQFSAATADEAVRPDVRYFPRSRLLWVEQTANLGGGSVWPLREIEAATAVARRHGLATHMDGARLMNAVVASGVSAREFAAPFDSVWIDFTKGLGAPVGAAIAGSRAFITEAWRLKQQMGGAMRQAGIIAAGGLFALRHHVKRLAEDHANARRLAEGLARLPGVKLDPASVETNLVFFDLTGELDAPTVVERMLALGVRMGAMSARTIRAVTHLDVSAAQVEQALAAASTVLGGGR